MADALSVASVTLAYNPGQLLRAQLEALLRQNRPLDEIIIVNNGPTNDVFDMVSVCFSQVRIMDLPENLGPGGGYAAGLAYAAIEKKHDWVWLLDQDSIPRDDSLAQLLDGLAFAGSQHDHIGIVASVCSHSDTQLSYPGLLWRKGFFPPSDEASKQPTCFVDVVISSGSLIHRDVVTHVGLPRADFFIDFVDFEYCLRVRRAGFKIAVVRDSHLEHAIGHPRTTTFLGYSKAWAAHEPWREYYMSRNETFTIWNYYPDWRSKFSVLQRLLRHATAVIAFGEQRLACLKMMFVGFLDGRAGRLGLRFAPRGKKNSSKASTDRLLTAKSGPD